MLTNLQCEKFHLRKNLWRDKDVMLLKEERLLVTIRRVTLDAFCIREPRMFKVNSMMVKRLGKVGSDKIGLEIWLPPTGHFLLVDEVGMSLACTTLMFSLRKGRHYQHLQWDLMRKALSAW